MRLGKWGGINVYIHWTFWILIAFYLVTVSLQSGPLAGVIAAVFVLSVFACVALHEFGHAGAAAYFGIRTLDITLLPIGGVARLERLPEKPYQEFVIALAGPAVNFVIAAVLVPLMLLGPLPLPGPAIAGEQSGFFGQLLAANLVLAIFNLLPAFPMDGGRVLRSLLAMRMGHLRATEIAARVGRWMAFLFGILGIYYQAFMLVLLAVFVFLAGTAELIAARVRAMGQELDGRAYPQSGGGQGWQTTAWPPSSGAGAFSAQVWQRAAGGRPHDDEVIDAVDVRELPRHHLEPPPSDL